MSQIRQKILATLLGLIFLFIVGEVTLALFAHFGVGRDVSQQRVVRNGAYRILFLGNSHTVGAGVGYEHSYPSVLRNFFEIMAPDQVSIINGGMASANTSVIFENLDSLVFSAKPHLVVIMAGEPNIWNRRGYAGFMASQKGEKEFEGFKKIFSFIEKSRILRWASTFSKLTDRVNLASEQSLEHKAYTILGRLLANSLPQDITTQQASEITAVLSEYITKVRSSPPSGSWKSLLNTLAGFKYNRGDIKGALELTQESLGYDSGNFNLRAYFLLEEMKSNESLRAEEKTKVSTLLTQAEKFFPGKIRYQYLKYFFHHGSKMAPPPEELKSVYEEGLRYAPESARAASTLAKIYLGEGEPAKAADILLRLIDSNPLFMDGDSLSSLNVILSGFIDDRLRERINRGLEKFNSRFPLEKNRFENMTDENLKSWIASDLEKIVEKLKKQNIAVLVQNYHWIRDRKEAAALYESSRLAAERQSVPFLDTHSEFLKYAEHDTEGAQSYFTDAFGPNDSHPSIKGHRVIAKIIYEGLVQKKLLPSSLTKFNAEQIYPSVR